MSQLTDFKHNDASKSKSEMKSEMKNERKTIDYERMKS